MDPSNQFAINGLAAKCKSKSEFFIYSQRKAECTYPQDATQPYLRRIMMDKKVYVQSKNIMLIKVPHNKRLTVAKILRFAKSKENINNYIPDYKYCKEPNRE